MRVQQLPRLSDIFMFMWFTGVQEIWMITRGDVRHVIPSKWNYLKKPSDQTLSQNAAPHERGLIGVKEDALISHLLPYIDWAIVLILLLHTFLIVAFGFFSRIFRICLIAEDEFVFWRVIIWMSLRHQSWEICSTFPEIMSADDKWAKRSLSVHRSSLETRSFWSMARSARNSSTTRGQLLISSATSDIASGSSPVPRYIQNTSLASANRFSLPNRGRSTWGTEIESLKLSSVQTPHLHTR